uniref:ADP-ribosylation factor n=1 Tax=Bionectria ochroleuca TaxID=29856 RepID=A0A8H7N0E8_BIOOC
MALEEKQMPLTEIDEESIVSKQPSAEIRNTTNKIAPETRNSWFPSFRSIFPSLLSKEQPGTTITRLFDNVPGYPRIALIGLDWGGKSLLMEKFLSPRSKDIHRIMPTIGTIVEMVRSETASFHTYDIGGCRPKSSRLFDRAMYREAEAVVFVIDANDRDRALEAREELMMEGLLDPQGMRKETPLLILANKQDLPNARNAEQIKTFFVDSISTSIGDRPCNVFATTATTGEGIEDAFRWLASILAERTNNEKTSNPTGQGQYGTKRPTPEEEIQNVWKTCTFVENKPKVGT